MMTQQVCAGICALGGFKYMALQAGHWCSCDNSYGSQGPAPPTDCLRVCDGNSSQYCGGGYRNLLLRLDYAFNDNLFVLGNRTQVSISKPNMPSYSTKLGIRNLRECLYQCQSPIFQAVIFNQQQGLCHLLEYAVVPDTLSNTDSGDFYVRG